MVQPKYRVTLADLLAGAIAWNAHAQEAAYISRRLDPQRRIDCGFADDRRALPQLLICGLGLAAGHWPHSPDPTNRQNDQEPDDGSNDHHDLDPRIVKALAREDECDRKVPRPRAEGEHPPRVGVCAADQPSDANAENSE